VTEERFQVEWVTEFSKGIEWLRDGGVRVAVLDLNLPPKENTSYA
jgi:DNA-binding response OmpR family regulator